MRVYADVSVSVADWSKMRARLIDVIGDYRDNPPPLPQDENRRGAGFPRLDCQRQLHHPGRARNIAFPMVMRRRTLSRVRGWASLRDPSVKVLRRGAELVIMTPEIREFLQKPRRD